MLPVQPRSGGGHRGPQSARGIPLQRAEGDEHGTVQAWVLGGCGGGDRGGGDARRARAGRSQRDRWAGAERSDRAAVRQAAQTLASSADDLVSWYSRALQGQHFEGGAALQDYRAILSLGDIIWLLPVPLGVSAFAKGGAIDVPGFHALCGAGGMFFDEVWVYFCLTINWDAAAEVDPATVEAWAAAGSRALQLVKDALSA